MMESSIHATSFTIRILSRTDCFYVRRIPVWKRGLDIVGAVLGLVLLSPLFGLTALYIRMVSPGPVIFKQTRIGFGGKPFEFIKFRTMTLNADTSGHQQYLAELIHGGGQAGGDQPMVKLEADSRIIPLGGFLRKSYMDELPQLVNVLKGEMSLVGPRPPIPYEVAEYLKWHNGRFDCMPGMTGLWQISGKNSLSFKQMVRLDIKYARSMSLFLDIKILLMTPVAILKELWRGARMKHPSGEGAGSCTT